MVGCVVVFAFGVVVVVVVVVAVVAVAVGLVVIDGYGHGHVWDHASCLVTPVDFVFGFQILQPGVALVRCSCFVVGP